MKKAKVDRQQSAATKKSGLHQTVTGILLVSVALSIMHTLSTASFSPALFLSLLLVFTSSVLIGILLVSVMGLHDQKGIDFIPTFLMGMIALAVILMILAFVSPMGMRGNLLLILFSIIMFVWAKSGRKILEESFKFVNQLYLDKTGFWSIVIILISSGLWSTENLQGLSFPSLETIEIHPWIDTCFHARFISVFMNSYGPGTFSGIYLFGQHLLPYHYGSYMIPALLGSLSGVSTFSLAAAVLAPFGLIWTGLAAYTFGKTCFDERAGFMAVVGILLIPDASYIGMGNRWSGYSFFQQIGMGGAYGVSVLAMAWSCAILAIRNNSIYLLILSLIVCAISALFKVQITIVYVIPFLIYIAVYFRKFHWRIRFIALLLAGVFYCICAKMLYRIPEAPNIGFSVQGAYVNLSTIIKFFNPDRTVWMKNLLEVSSSYFWQLLMGIPLILLVTYGVWVILLPFSVRHVLRMHYPSFIMIIPILTITAHLIIALCLEPTHTVLSDPFEIIHKTFVWPYFMIAVWCSSVTGISVGNAIYFRTHSVKILLVVLIVFDLYFISIMAETTQTGFALSKIYTRLQFPRGLYEAAEYIRLHTPTNSVIQYSENDGYGMVACFSERYTYFSHGIINRGVPSEEARNRAAIVEQILNLPDFSSVKRAAENVGIHWLIISNQRKLSWQNTEGAKPAFQYSGFSVYKTKEE
jgi:hypothetical protein